MLSSYLKGVTNRSTDYGFASRNCTFGMAVWFSHSIKVDLSTNKADERQDHYKSKINCFLKGLLARDFLHESQRGHPY